MRSWFSFPMIPAKPPVNYFIFKLMGFPDLRIYVSDCGCALLGPEDAD